MSKFSVWGLLLTISLLLPITGRGEEMQFVKDDSFRNGPGPGKVVQAGKDHRQDLKQITRRKSNMNNVKDFGAVGDGKTKDTTAIQKAIDAGGIVFFPPGVYLSGTLYLKSNGGLDLAPGAVLLASPDKKDYNANDFCVQNSFSVNERASGAHFIVALEQKNIVIRGGGVIDGNRKAFYNEIWKEHPTVFKLTDWRPGQMMYFCECENVRVTDVSLNNAPYWTLFLHGCEQVNVRGVHIWNDFKTHNGDGIDIDCCRYVTVSDCTIHSGDDCITFRGDNRKLKNKRICENITVTNCIIETRCNAIRVGVGNSVIRNCTVSNIIISDAGAGIHLCSRYSPNAEGVTIENILFSDILMYSKRPVAVSSDVRGVNDKAIKPIRNIVFRNVNGTASRSFFVESNHRGDIRDIVFSGIRMKISGGEEVKEGPGILYGEFAAASAPAAFHLANAEKITFRDVQIEWNTDSPNWKYGIMAENSEPLTIASDCNFGKPNLISDGKRKNTNSAK